MKKNILLLFLLTFPAGESLVKCQQLVLKKNIEYPHRIRHVLDLRTDGFLVVGNEAKFNGTITFWLFYHLDTAYNLVSSDTIRSSIDIVNTHVNFKHGKAVLLFINGEKPEETALIVNYDFIHKTLAQKSVSIPLNFTMADYVCKDDWLSFLLTETNNGTLNIDSWNLNINTFEIKQKSIAQVPDYISSFNIGWVSDSSSIYVAYTKTKEVDRKDPLKEVNYDIHLCDYINGELAPKEHLSFSLRDSVGLVYTADLVRESDSTYYLFGCVGESWYDYLTSVKTAHIMGVFMAQISNSKLTWITKYSYKKINELDWKRKNPGKKIPRMFGLSSFTGVSLSPVIKQNNKYYLVQDLGSFSAAGGIGYGADYYTKGDISAKGYSAPQNTAFQISYGATYMYSLGLCFGNNGDMLDYNLSESGHNIYKYFVNLPALSALSTISKPAKLTFKNKSIEVLFFDSNVAAPLKLSFPEKGKNIDYLPEDAILFDNSTKKTAVEIINFKKFEIKNGRKTKSSGNALYFYEIKL